MGFGAGFAAGFVPAYNNQRQMSHERDTDEFRYRMETLVKNKEKYETKKAASDSAAKLSKEIVMATGQPPEAAAAAYNLLINGASYNDVYEQFSKKTFKPAPVDDTVASGIAEPIAPEVSNTPAPAPKSKGVLGDMGVPDFMGMGNRADRIESRVGKTTGMTPEEIAQIDAGFTNPEMDSSGTWENKPDPYEAPDTLNKAQVAADAAAMYLKQYPTDLAAQSANTIAQRDLLAIQKAELYKGSIESQTLGNGPITGAQPVLVKIPGKPGEYKQYAYGSWDELQGGYVDENGKLIPGAMGRSPEEKEALATLAKDLGPKADEHNKKKAAWGNMMTTAGSMMGAVERTNGAVLSEGATGLAGFIQNLTAEAKTLGEFVVSSSDQTVANTDPTQLQNAATKLDQLNKAYQGTDAGKAALEATLFKAQKNMLAYYYGATVGQTDRAISEVEREMFANMAAAGATPEQFYQNMAGLALNAQKNIDREGQLIGQTPAVRNFIQENQVVPDLFSPTPVEDIIKGDVAANNLMGILRQYEGTASGTDITPRIGPGAVEAPVPEVIDPAVKQAAEAATPEGFTYESTKNGYNYYRGADGKLIKQRIQ